MTRINSVPPSELSNPHLLVEIKEITRVYRMSWKALRKGEDPRSFPDSYRLGTGHIQFFYARLGYIHLRQLALEEEAYRRGYTVPMEKRAPWVREIEPYGRVTILDWPTSWRQHWEPDEQAMAINRARLEERMKVINSWK